MDETINEEERMIAMADELTQLNQKLNGGRGIQTIRSIAIYLRQGDIDSAQAVCWNDGDKITDPEVREYLVKNLYHGENHPWPASYEAPKTEI